MICSGSTAKENETTEIGILLHLYYETHCGEKGTFSCFLFRVVVVWDLVEFCVSSIICAYFSYDALDE